MLRLTLSLLFLHALRATVTVYINPRGAFQPEEPQAEPRPAVAVLTLPLSKVLRGKVKQSLEQEQALGDADLLNAVSRMTFFPASYAKWLERQNIRVVPLDFNLPEEQMFEVLRRTSGLLMTGGSVGLFQPDKKIDIDGHVARVVKLKEPSAYTRKVNALLGFAKALNDNNRHFPVWGTCLGFEGMMLAESDLQLPINRIFNLNTNRPLIFRDAPSEPENEPEMQFEEPEEEPEEVETVEVRADQCPNLASPRDILDFLTREEREELENEDLVFFNHDNAFFPHDFDQLDRLKEQYKIVAVSPAKSPLIKEPIIAVVQNKKYPFYGVQFHPEKIYEHSQRISPNRSPDAQKIAEKFSKFFVDQLAEPQHESSEEAFDRLDDYKVLKAPNIGVFDEVFLLLRKELEKKQQEEREREKAQREKHPQEKRTDTGETSEPGPGLVLTIDPKVVLANYTKHVL